MKTRVAALAVLTLFTVSSWVTAAPDFEKAAPEDTLAFASLRNVPALQERVKQHSIYGIWQEPSVQKFLEKPAQFLKQKLQEGEAKTGVKLDDVWSLFHGQVALVLTSEPKADEPDLVVLADVGNDGERAMKLMATLYETATKDDKGPKRTVVEESFEGAKLVHLRPAAAPKEEEAAAKPVTLTYGVAGDVFLFGSSEAAIKRTVSFLKAPPEKSLATSAPWKAVVQKIGQDADLLLFGNVPAIVALMKQDKDIADKQGAQIMDALGLNGVGGAGLSVTLSQGYGTWQLYVQTLGERAGIAKILMPPPGELHSGAEAPADAASFASVRFDAAGIFDDVMKILATAAPQVQMMFNMQMNALSEKLGAPFNLRNDVLAIFGPRMAMYSRYEQPYNLKTSQQVIIMADITNKAAFNGAWDKLNKISPEAFAVFQEKEYLGQKMYVVTPPARDPTVPPPEGQPVPAFVVTDREFIFSPSVEALQAHLRRMNAKGPTLRDRPEFQEALKTLPGDGRVMIGFEDKSRQVEFLFKALKNKEEGLGMIFERLRDDPNVAEFLDLFDLNLLPPAEDITKHMMPSAFCAIVQPDGLLVISKSKAKPSEKEK